MKYCLTVLLLMVFANAVYSSSRTDSLLTVLIRELAKKHEYDSQKEQRIKALKKQLAAVSATDYAGQYAVCSRLYEEYKVYKFDSAYVYTQRLLAESAALKDVSKKNESNVKLAFILLSSGMFKETFDCLHQINIRALSNDLKEEYYSICARAYTDLADYNNGNRYASSDYAASIKYLDSAISITMPQSYEWSLRLGDKKRFLGQATQAAFYYQRLLYQQPLTLHQQAVVSTILSFCYKGTNYRDYRIELLANAAINDVRSSTHETLAIFKLGEQLYKDGDIINAYTLIQAAMDDALYYGAKLRAIQIGTVLPVVAAKRLILIEQDKQKFFNYLMSIGTVAIIILLISFIVFNQLKRLKVKEKIIEHKNLQLEKINNKLTEDTRIKEEYIGNFFTIISGYILTLEKLKRSIEKKVATKRFDEVSSIADSINIKKERESLFHTFDHIFLKIFPNFISAFNSMFDKEHQIWPKGNEVMNTELRIFALIRLGINDNQTIANILEYSVNTIYVYKMRIKAKALVSGDQFDQRIMAVQAVDESYQLQQELEHVLL